MKKNIVVVLLMILGVVLIGGCVPQAPVPEAEEAPAPPAEKVELEWWTVQAGEQPTIAYWDYIIEEFEKKYPNVKVKRVDMIDEDFKTGLTSSMAAGIPPDLWFSWGGGILKSQVDAGHVADLTDLLTEPWAKEVVPRSAVAQSTFYDKHYAVPFTVWIGHFYVNTDLFDKVGLEVPKKPWSWDEFKEAIETFKANGVIPITVGGKEKWELSFYYMYLVDRIGSSEIFRKAINRAPGYTFEDPSFVQAGERAQELVEMGAFQDGFLGADYDTAQRLFLEGKAAMYLMGSWFPPAMRAEYPEFPLDTMPFPTIPGGKGDPTMLLGATQNHWAISEASEHKEEAKELLRFMFSKENILKYAQDVGDLVVFNVDLPAGTYDPVLEKVLGDMEKASWMQMAWDQYSPPKFASVHLDTLAALLAGEMTPEEMASEQEKVAQELKEEGVLPIEPLE